MTIPNRDYVFRPMFFVPKEALIGFIRDIAHLNIQYALHKCTKIKSVRSCIGPAKYRYSKSKQNSFSCFVIDILLQFFDILPYNVTYTRKHLPDIKGIQ